MHYTHSVYKPLLVVSAQESLSAVFGVQDTAPALQPRLHQLKLSSGCGSCGSGFIAGPGLLCCFGARKQCVHIIAKSLLNLRRCAWQ